MNSGVRILKEKTGRIAVSFPYNPVTLPVIAIPPAPREFEGRLSREKQSHMEANKIPSPLVGEGKACPERSRRGEGDFQVLRRELLSRKYSYKTVRAYTYFNRDFLNFSEKSPSEIYPVRNDYSYYLFMDKVSEISNGVYTHVSTKNLGKIRSPLDSLPLKKEGVASDITCGVKRCWQFSQSWNKRSSSSILPKWNKKRSTSPMNELSAMPLLNIVYYSNTH